MSIKGQLKLTEAKEQTTIKQKDGSQVSVTFLLKVVLISF